MQILRSGRLHHVAVRFLDLIVMLLNQVSPFLTSGLTSGSFFLPVTDHMRQGAHHGDGYPTQTGRSGCIDSGQRHVPGQNHPWLH